MSRLGEMKGAVGVLVGDMKARDARRKQEEERTLIRVRAGQVAGSVTIGVHSTGNFWTS